MPLSVKPNLNSIFGRKCTPMTTTSENGSVPIRPIAVMPIFVNCRSSTPPYSPGLLLVAQKAAAVDDARV